jgi:AcrR family transcriptional regulator
MRAARQTLDRQRILDAALAFVDREGLDAFSMRKLGSELGVEAMALYHYFPSKAALVDALVGLVLAGLELPQPRSGSGEAWAGVLRQVARSFRDLGTAHPNIFPLLATLAFDNPASLVPAEAVLQVLIEAGLSPRHAFDAFVALKSFVVGYTLWAIGNNVSGQRRAEPPHVVLECGGVDYPRLTELTDWLAERPLDVEFDACLDVLLDGLRARLSTTAASPAHAG